jgi:hypothetical protein
MFKTPGGARPMCIKRRAFLSRVARCLKQAAARQQAGRAPLLLSCSNPFLYRLGSLFFLLSSEKPWTWRGLVSELGVKLGCEPVHRSWELSRVCLSIPSPLHLSYRCIGDVKRGRIQPCGGGASARVLACGEPSRGQERARGVPCSSLMVVVRPRGKHVFALTSPAAIFTLQP